MQTRFSSTSLADPQVASSEAVIRKCVHCGFCTATCPTYVLLGDELDSPRGRIYLIKSMLEEGATPSPEVVKHIDRCLSCLSCMTTCPSGVNYMHLVDHARAYIAETYRRPLVDRVMRQLLLAVLPYPGRFRFALALARLARPAARILPAAGRVASIRAMLELAPAKIPARPSAKDSPARLSRSRVAMLGGCAEPVVRPEYRAAAVRLLNRAGIDVIFPKGQACCGALAQHMGETTRSLAAARVNVDAWTLEIESEGLDAILVTASGCGTTIKDYGHMLRGDPAYAKKAARVSALARDIAEYLDGADLHYSSPSGLKVVYHAACSLRHGQNIDSAPRRLLLAAGYVVVTPREAHLCCGSAGTYNIMQPVIARQLGDRKVANLVRERPDIIAAGNAGCALQIASRTEIPVVHTVELLDWAAGGPAPVALNHHRRTHS